MAEISKYVRTLIVIKTHFKNIYFNIILSLNFLVNKLKLKFEYFFNSIGSGMNQAAYARNILIYNRFAFSAKDLFRKFPVG